MSNRNRNVKNLADVTRYRNGRLAIDVLARRQKPRWRMLFLDGDWYDRNRLRAELARLGEFVPQTRRALRLGEILAIRDTQPWRLRPR